MNNKIVSLIHFVDNKVEIGLIFDENSLKELLLSNISVINRNIKHFREGMTHKDILMEEIGINVEIVNKVLTVLIQTKNKNLLTMDKEMKTTIKNSFFSLKNLIREESFPGGKSDLEFVVKPSTHRATPLPALLTLMERYWK